MLQWLESLSSKLRIRRSTVVRVANLSDGQIVRVVGRARAENGPLPLPLRGGEAATFTLRVYERRRRSGLGQAWGTTRERVLLDDVDHGETFLLDDGTGVARVELGGWSKLVSPVETRIGAGPFLRLPDAGIDRYAARFGEHARNIFRGFGGGYEYEELAVPEGAEVEAVGRVRELEQLGSASRPAGYRTAPKAFVIGPPGHDRLLIRVRDVR